ncbi:MAG: peptidyl-prolyl cis-trans isomerase [Candidatus Aminicenantales bacterium]
MNRILNLAVAAAIVFLSGLLGAQETVEAIVAIVNDDIITLSEYRAEHEMLYQILRSQFRGEEFDEQYEKQKSLLLDRMITERLLLQEARKKDINVEEQLKMLIDNIKTQNNIGSDEELRRLMAQQGVDFEIWKREQEQALLQQALVFSEVGRSIVIDETDVVNYYDQHREEFTEPAEVKLRAIYVSAEGRTEEQLRARMKEIEERLAAGEDMGALAEEYSDGPEKESQGDLGTFKKGELNEALEQAVEGLEEGELSPWIKMPGGWYLIRVEKRTESRLKPFEEVKKDIENSLFNQEQQKKFEAYLEDLKKRSFIKILIPDPLNYRGLTGS